MGIAPNKWPNGLSKQFLTQHRPKGQTRRRRQKGMKEINIYTSNHSLSIYLLLPPEAKSFHLYTRDSSNLNIGGSSRRNPTSGFLLDGLGAGTTGKTKFNHLVELRALSDPFLLRQNWYHQLLITKST
ncbi:hypothetical protein LOK49_LG03G00955 [Camellia lanceoleosa]|uniref:Uncharacterized protein n=1 Tax=Camellia lanceoleosa TaxID=1840588 RepID=A0ACC0IC41_9ERIC|nr:hypothetical protein LOK49_LG03G00955 [Camellia lanceoleosa]